ISPNFFGVTIPIAVKNINKSGTSNRNPRGIVVIIRKEKYSFAVIIISKFFVPRFIKKPKTVGKMTKNPKARPVKKLKKMPGIYERAVLFSCSVNAGFTNFQI